MNFGNFAMCLSSLDNLHFVVHLVSIYANTLRILSQTHRLKDTQKKDDVRLSHKLSLTTAVNITLWRKEREGERQRDTDRLV